MRWSATLAAAVTAAVFGLALATQAAVVVPRIGIVFLPEYKGAKGVHPDLGTRELRFSEPVYAAETVRTGPGGSTALEFLDATRLQVGANSTVVLDEFVYDPDAGTAVATIEFGTGIFRYVGSGLGTDKNVQLRTPTTVLAIRGTKLIIFVDVDGSTTAAVLEGEVEATPCGGDPVAVESDFSVIVPASCTGATVVAGVATPSTDVAVTSDISALGNISTAAGGTTTGSTTTGGTTTGGTTTGAAGPGNGNGNATNSNGGGNLGGSGPGTGNGGQNSGGGGGAGNGGGGSGGG